MFAIIVNPVSGGREGAQLVEQMKALIAEKGHTAHVFATECEGDATQKARQALEEGYTSVVSVGGDGTLSEVVQAVAGSTATLYVVPTGTGNDFARAFGLPKKPIDAFREQLQGERVQIDCLTANGCPFINVGGSGFDVEVLRKTEELKAVYPGEVAYRKAVLAVLGSYQAIDAEISVDGGQVRREKATIIEMANGRYFGGGMLVAPGSDMQDGLMDVVIVGRVPSWGIPFLLPLFIKGWHVKLPICKVVKAKEVRLKAPNLVVNMDGRLEPMDEVVFGILPGALTMMRP